MTTHDIDKALKAVTPAKVKVVTNEMVNVFGNEMWMHIPNTKTVQTIRFALRFTKAALGEPSEETLSAMDEKLDTVCSIPVVDMINAFKAMVAQIVKEIDNK